MTEKTTPPDELGAASCSVTVERCRAMAESCYRSASRARQQMVKLAPQYRRKDIYNAEGEFLETIRLQMQMRRLSLKIADKLESESLTNTDH